MSTTGFKAENELLTSPQLSDVEQILARVVAVFPVENDDSSDKDDKSR